jgi:nascent polypeptide-associated complex subunit alpha
MTSNLTKQMQSAQIASDSDDDIPDLVEGDAVDAAGTGGDVDTSATMGDDTPQGRAERKARKSLAKLGLKKVEGINRVTMRRPKGQFIVIANAEVYKSPHSDCYVVFGEAKAAEDPTGGFAGMAGGVPGGVGGGMGAASQFAAQEQLEALAKSASGAKKPPPKEIEEEEGEVDETGIDPADIETVMSEVPCSRAKAVKALKDEGGDIINAIMTAS